MRFNKLARVFANSRRLFMVLALLTLSFQLFAQTETVSGTVMDEQGSPIAGATVLVKGSSVGTTTDDQGKFSIRVSPTGTLLISNVGYTSVERGVGHQNELTIILKQLGTSLEDVVVVGYGTKSRRDVGGAVLSVDQKLLKDRPVTNTLSALQGTAPGLVITRTNGQPGREGISARIRGITSLGASNAPLVIIDGVEGDINALNPNDIQTISVLEDAASASIYGAKAGGGVILVTTKGGKANQKTQVDFTSMYTFRTPYARPELISSCRQAELQNAARIFAS